MLQRCMISLEFVTVLGGAALQRCLMSLSLYSVIPSERDPSAARRARARDLCIWRWTWLLARSFVPRAPSPAYALRRRASCWAGF